MLATEDHPEFNDMQIETNASSNTGERTTKGSNYRSSTRVLERAWLLVMES